MKNHHILDGYEYKHILVERLPLKDDKNSPVESLINYRISLNNPGQLNSYTTEAVKEVILAFREASCNRSCVAVIFTGVGDKAFCTGGNTKEYAEYYAGNPQEYKQYMRLFNDMVSGILTCDKPVINRVNGMRIAGGQEIGMACDFTVAADTARFGQAGPKHGSAPDGGSTDFLHLFVGINHAMESCTLCENWSATKAAQLGLVNRLVPVLKDAQGNFVPDPFVVREAHDSWGNPTYGNYKTGSAKEEAKKIAAQCSVDLSQLDKEVDSLCYRLAMTMPECLTKTIESVRKKKLEHWQRNCETNRSWLALNMMTEARAGFVAFNSGPKNNREVNFIRLRQELGRARPWSESLLQDILPKA